MATTDEAKGGFRLTGLHVLAMLIAFFGVIFAVNGVMTYLALETFPGAATASSYTASQRYNGEIAAARAQSDRGWQVEEHLSRVADGNARLSLTVADRAGRPVEALAVTARLQHPVKQGEDVVAELRQTGAGGYAGDFAGVEPGQWTLEIEARAGGDRVWRSENRVVLR
jgi:nitrogen fixation protein FixH